MTRKTLPRGKDDSDAKAIVWFRLDLRFRDNPALDAAARFGAHIIPVFIWSPEEEAPWQPGGASRWWMHQSLCSLGEELHKVGSRLIIRRGPSLASLRNILNETGAKAVFCNRRYEPAVIARDAGIKESLRRDGLTVESFNAALLHEPWTVQNGSGKPFQVFTPFWKHCLTKPDPLEPWSAPKVLPSPNKWPKSLALEELELEPKIPWAGGLQASWRPGESGARERLKRFVSDTMARYSDDRNRPDLDGTSQLSPHLHFGEISPRQIWNAIRQKAEAEKIPPAIWRNGKFLTELGWREFAHHLLYHFPQTPAEPLRAEFKKFPWHTDAEILSKWQKGRTGYPIVDAGMRQLWMTGWMHNRVRMIVASFLVKDLLISWEEGTRWFWDTLVDADLAQNTLGWQWTAGCGADAAPYFRVFNPVMQSEKFDPKGVYIRKWCPELAELPDKWLHQPWAMPASDLYEKNKYPERIVNHAIAREVALEAFARIKSPV